MNVLTVATVKDGTMSTRSWYVPDDWQPHPEWPELDVHFDALVGIGEGGVDPDQVRTLAEEAGFLISGADVPPRTDGA